MAPLVTVAHHCRATEDEKAGGADLVTDDDGDIELDEAVRADVREEDGD